MNGNGRCICVDGYYGLDCSTDATTTKCDPRCAVGKGACDETTGKCVCWDNHSGPTCANEDRISNNVLIIVIVLSIVGVIALIAAFIFLMIRCRNARKRSIKVDLGTPAYNLLDDI